MYKLIIQDDEGKTTVVPLIRDEITIGRKEGNTIRLTERNVSRRHARIVKVNGGGILVEDLDSYNGVKVNGTRIQGRVAVNESDRIQIGDYLLEVKLDRGAQDAYSSGVTPPAGSVIPGTPMGGAPPPMPGAMGPQAPMGPVQQTAQLGPMADPNAVAQQGAAGAMAPQGGNGGAARQRATAPMPTYPSEPPTVPMGAPGGAQQPGRLVVVSSNFGGREFVLDRPVMVIGRTDDNDVVVNHRSISRHHAKIVLEQGRYCIVDMQSSNGVRVNGEEYGKVELRRGDMIDLGHVRLRYVEPGEDFVFDRDATLVDVAVRSRGKGALITASSLIVVAVVVAVIFVVQRGSGEAPVAMSEPAPAGPTAAATAPTAAPAPAPASQAHQPVAAKPAATAVDAAVPEPVPAVEKPPAMDPTKEVQRLVAEGRQAVSDEKWVSALSAADQILKVDPANSDAKKLQDQANAEFRNQTTYEKLVKARDGGRVADVVRLEKDIPETSVYHARAAADVAKMHEQFIRARESDARAYASRGQCNRILALARRSADIFPDARQAVERAGAGCVQPPAAAKPVEAEPPPLAETLSDAQISSIIADAKKAARNNNWAEARRKADEVLRIRPSDQDALSVAGIAACNLSDKERALKYIDRLRGERQHIMKQICAEKGVPTD